MDMFTKTLNQNCPRQQQLPVDFRSLLSEDELLRLTLLAQTSSQSDSEQRMTPQSLLTLLTYAYITGRLSTEKLMSDFANDATFRYICFNRCPSNTAIRSFRRYNRQVLIKCMARTMSLGMNISAERSANKLRDTQDNLSPMPDVSSCLNSAWVEAEYRVSRAAQLDCMAMDE